MLPLFHYQGKYDPFKSYKTFLVVGETGAGKTTLLDAFINYLQDMEFSDNWRWKVVDESHLYSKIGKSKTSEITTYYLNDVRNRFNVKIIDTPGFGDTGGVNVDD